VTEPPEDQLEAGLRALGIPHAAAVSAKLIHFGKVLLEENKRTNLTGARSIDDLIKEHFLDSLAPLKFVELVQPIVDVGSGAGFPGIPAAIAFPNKKIVLLEPRAKRAEFLSVAARKLGLKNVSVIKSSARGPGAAPVAGKAGTVLIRAVAQPAIAFGLGLPLLRPGGHLVLYEGRAARATREDRRAAATAGAGDLRIRRVVVPGLSATRHAWIVRKMPVGARRAKF
jgi:16S rRNA (guanine527-N7)-methyltransferase